MIYNGNITNTFSYANGWCTLPVQRGVVEANASVHDIEKILKQRIEKRNELIATPDADPAMIACLDSLIKNLQGTLQRKNKSREILKGKMAEVFKRHNERVLLAQQISKGK